MAQMVESTLVVKVSKLIKDNEEATVLIDDEILSSLEAVIGELIADHQSLIEVIRA